MPKFIVNSDITSGGLAGIVVTGREVEATSFKTEGEFVDFRRHLGGDDYETVYRVAAKQVLTIERKDD